MGRVQSTFSKLSRGFLSSFFEYQTPHIVHIQSYKVGILARVVELFIIAYVVGYVIIYQNGYQDISDLNSVVTTKLKGVLMTKFKDENFPNVRLKNYRRIWDVADYVIPPQENGAFFVMTNVIVTPNQTLGTCPEDPSVSKAHCDPNGNGCQEGEPLQNGIMTGKCVKSNKKRFPHTCEINAWCPVENDTLPLGKAFPLLVATKNFTVLVKNSIEFVRYHVRRRNILSTIDETYLNSCKFNPQTDPTCPIFKLETIVTEAGENYEDIAIQGGVMGIFIHWDCNLDFDIDTYCIPRYSFRRLDDPNAKISKGWNFRYASYYSDKVRTLYKAYGIRFIVVVEGTGRKFSIIPLVVNIASGFALLGLTTVVCDFVILYILNCRDYYKDKKFLVVKDEMKKKTTTEIPAPANV